MGMGRPGKAWGAERAGCMHAGVGVLEWVCWVGRQGGKAARALRDDGCEPGRGTVLGSRVDAHGPMSRGLLHVWRELTSRGLVRVWRGLGGHQAPLNAPPGWISIPAGGALPHCNDERQAVYSGSVFMRCSMPWWRVLDGGVRRGPRQLLGLRGAPGLSTMTPGSPSCCAVLRGDAHTLVRITNLGVSLLLFRLLFCC